MIYSNIMRGETYNLRTILESKGSSCTTLGKTSYPEREISTKKKMLWLHFQQVKPMMIKKKIKKKHQEKYL